MVNLFLAILLGNFDASRTYLNKAKKFEEIKFYRQKKRLPLSVVLVRVLGDLGDHINKKIIY